MTCTCNCNKNYNTCNNCCFEIYSPVTENYSHKFYTMECVYPLSKCNTYNFGTKPRYYSMPYVLLACKTCSPCN